MLKYSDIVIAYHLVVNVGVSTITLIQFKLSALFSVSADKLNLNMGTGLLFC